MAKRKSYLINSVAFRSAEELARYLGVTGRTIANWEDAGTLESKVLAYMREGQVKVQRTRINPRNPVEIHGVLYANHREAAVALRLRRSQITSAANEDKLDTLPSEGRQGREVKFFFADHWWESYTQLAHYLRVTPSWTWYAMARGSPSTIAKLEVKTYAAIESDMPFYICAYYEDGSQILGNLDGQGVIRSRRPLANRSWVDLGTEASLRYPKVFKWTLETSEGTCLSTKLNPYYRSRS